MKNNYLTTFNNLQNTLMLKITTAISLIFTVLFLISCNSDGITIQDTLTDTSKNLSATTENDNRLTKDNNSQKRNTVPINEYPIPNSFLGLSIGMTKESFFKNYPDATEGSFWVVMTKIRAKGMKVFTIEKSTTSDDEVQIDCCFWKDKLAIISVEYKDYQNETEILTGLKSKYGSYSQRKTFNWNDFTNQQDRTTTITRWEQSGFCILELDCTLEIGLTELIFANKDVQAKLTKEKELEDKSKIE